LPILRTLSVDDISISFSFNLFHNADSFQNLRSLHLILGSRNQSDKLLTVSPRDLLTVIASTCRLPVSLLLHFEYKAYEGIAIDFVAMKPVLETLCLHTFSIIHPLPLSLSAEDATKIAKACGQSIRALTLSPREKYFDVPHARFGVSERPFEEAWGAFPRWSLSALEPFAQFCPNLEKLEMYLDTRFTAPVLQNPSISFTNRLQQLNFGNSRLEWNDQHMIDYLRRLIHGRDIDPAKMKRATISGAESAEEWRLVDLRVNRSDR
jgi:hypothetical protein